MSIPNFNRIMLAYDDLGTGEAIVLIHGHPFNRMMWSSQTAMLSSQYRVIRPDLRGYGETIVTRGKVSLEEHVTDIHRLLRHVRIDTFILAGFSMGGQIAMEYYRQFREQVRALVLIDTFAQLDTPQRKEDRIKTADRIVRDGMNDYAAELLPKMITPMNAKDQSLAVSRVLNMMRGTSPEGAAASLRGRAERRDYVPLLSEITVPTLIIVGDKDEFTPVSDAELMHSLIPNSKLEIIEGAAHMPNIEREIEFNAVLLRWLGSIRL